MLNVKTILLQSQRTYDFMKLNSNKTNQQWYEHFAALNKQRAKFMKADKQSCVRIEKIGTDKNKMLKAQIEYHNGLGKVKAEVFLFELIVHLHVGEIYVTNISALSRVDFALVRENLASTPAVANK